MELDQIVNLFNEHPARYAIQNFLNKESKGKLHLKGLQGSSLAVLAASLPDKKSAQVFVLNDKEEAAYFYNDLCTLLDDKQVLYFPSSFKRSAQYESTDNSNIILRAEVLNRLVSNQYPSYIVTFPEAIAEKVISPSQLEENTLKIGVGERLSPEFIEEVLVDYNFERSDFVVGPGQYSIRGSIIDIFSFSDEYPYRIDFFGEEVESIRLFDVENQLSKEKLTTVDIIPNIQENLNDEARIPFLKFLPENAICWCKNITFIADRINSIYEKTIEKKAYIEFGEDKIAAQDYLMQGADFIDQVNAFSGLEFGQKFFFPAETIIHFNQGAQPAFNKNFDLLGQELLNNNAKALENYILSDNPKQIERIHSIFEDKGIDVIFTDVNHTLHQGFTDADLRIACYTDHQIFDRHHKFRLKNASVHKAKETVTLKEITHQIE